MKPSFNSHLYGACGGTIYKTEAFLNSYDNFVGYIKGEVTSFAFLDMFMPVLYMLCGMPYSLNTELTEPKRNSDWLISQHSIVHDVKEIKYYG
jgi:hypothetical protein